MVAAQTGSTGKSGRVDADSQADYEPTPWEDANWEIVGEVSATLEFTPMAVAVCEAEAEQISDSMFPDYGGRDTSGKPTRWHLPEELGSSYQSGEKQQVTDEPEIARLRLEELEKIKAEEFARGVAQGRADAQAEDGARVAEMQERLATLMQDLKTQMDEVRTEVESQAVNLSLAVARKIIDQAVEINPEYIVDILREAISQAGASVIRSIRVSPEDLEFIEFASIEAKLREMDSNWQFIADPTVRAGCVLETSAGEIDFQLDRAWERVRDQVVKVIK